MSVKTRSKVEAYSRAAKVSMQADGVNSRGGLFYGITEVIRWTASAITLIKDVTFSGAVTFSGGTKASVVEVADAATYAVLAENSGKVHVMPDLTADCTISLPTPADGLNYEFILGAAIDAAHDWIIDTGSDTNFYIGGLQHNSDAPASNSVASDGDSNSVMTVNTPEAGTWVKVWCDGTNWFVTGVVHTENAPTFANQA